jgi:hypothetical protein
MGRLCAARMRACSAGPAFQVGRAWHSALGRWPLHVIEDAGHLVVEQPEAFRRALRAALDAPAGR